MTKAPRVSGKELIKRLKKHGFIIARIKGSHHILKHPDGRLTTVPVHKNDIIGPGLLLKILDDVELSVNEIQN